MSLASGGRGGVASSLPPNFLICLLDDFGREWVADYEPYLGKNVAKGAEWAYPNMHLWNDLRSPSAPNGAMMFTNAIVQPICGPTRWGMLSGAASSVTGVGTNFRDATLGVSAEAPSFGLQVTAPILGLPAALKLANSKYVTAHFGKSHLLDTYDHQAVLAAVGPNGYKLETTPPNLGLDYTRTKFGFDYADIHPLNEGGAYVWRRIINGVVSSIGNGIDLNEGDYPTSVQSAALITWLTLQRGLNKPWLVYFAPGPPHAEHSIPPASLTPSTTLVGGLAGAPPQGTLHVGGATYAATRPHFHLSIEGSLKACKNVWDSLTDAERLRTYVVLLCDNGTVGTVMPPGYAHGKRSLYGGGTNVPMLISGPGIQPGISDALFHVTDLYPTLIALAGGRVGTNPPSASIPQPLYGVDQSSVLKGYAQQVRTRALCHLFAPQLATVHGTRTSSLLSVVGYPHRLDPQRGRTLFRLVRQAFTNGTTADELYRQTGDFNEVTDLLQGQAPEQWGSVVADLIQEAVDLGIDGPI